MRTQWAIRLAAAIAVALCAATSNATLIVNDSGSLANVGDAIMGTMVIDGEVVDYALTLTAANIVGTIDWNGAGPRSTPGGLSWVDSGGDWTLQLALSRSANLVFSQNGASGLANEPQSRWTVLWDSSGPTTIVDPLSQMNDPATTAGAGIATLSSLARVFNDAAMWYVSGPDSTQYVIRWENTTGGGPGTDAFGFDLARSTLGNVQPPVPEPGSAVSLVLGLLALGVFRRRRENDGR